MKNLITLLTVLFLAFSVNAQDALNAIHTEHDQDINVTKLSNVIITGYGAELGFGHKESRFALKVLKVTEDKWSDLSDTKHLISVGMSHTSFLIKQSKDSTSTFPLDVYLDLDYMYSRWNDTEEGGSLQFFDGVNNVHDLMPSIHASRVFELEKLFIAPHFGYKLLYKIGNNDGEDFKTSSRHNVVYGVDVMYENYMLSVNIFSNELVNTVDLSLGMRF